MEVGKIIKATGRFVATFALLSLLGIAVLAALSNWLFADCAYEKQLEDYRNLPSPRLNSLFLQMQKITAENSSFYLSKEEVDERYPELSDLDFKHIDLNYQIILIGGCFDNKLMMSFGGLSRSYKKEPSISISWGEPTKSEKIWPK